MYICQLCHEIVPPHTPAHRQTVEIRHRCYTARPHANAFHQQGRLKQTNGPGGTGHEIVREIVVCPKCAETNCDRIVARVQIK